jgi:DNA-binding beta-propeller fold protein YncE
LKVTQTISVGGKLEFAAAEPGHVYVNVEDTGEIADIDSKSWKVAHKWKLTGCEEPSGLALDAKKERLFTVCGNKVMLVVNAKDGSVLATVPTGDGTDGAGFDPGTGSAFASNGEGTLTVVREGKSGKYEVAENVPTARGARTMTVDPKTHKIFTATAELGPPAEGQRRPTIKPDTFALLVFGQ